MKSATEKEHGKIINWSSKSQISYDIAIDDKEYF